MKKLLLLSLLVFASSSALAASFGSVGANGVELTFESLLRSDVQSSDVNIPNFPFEAGINGNFTAKRAIVALSYQPSPFKFSLLAGFVMSGQIDGANNNGTRTISQTLPFDSAFAYGAAMHWDVVSGLPFKIRPNFRYLHSNLKGTRGTTTADGCTYDYASGAAAGANCRSWSNIPISGGTFTMANEARLDEFTIGLDLSADLGLLTILAGAQQNLVNLRVTSVVTQTGASAGNESDHTSYQLARSESVYAGVGVGLGLGLQVSARYYALGQQMFSGTLAYSF